MNQDVNGNRKIWKEVSKENGGKVVNSNRIEMEGWYWKRLKYEGFGKSMISICII